MPDTVANMSKNICVSGVVCSTRKEAVYTNKCVYPSTPVSGGMAKSFVPTGNVAKYPSRYLKPGVPGGTDGTSSGGNGTKEMGGL
jgi:hypothetical protein